jgi:hypothetical protein
MTGAADGSYVGGGSHDVVQTLIDVSHFNACAVGFTPLCLR